MWFFLHHGAAQYSDVTCVVGSLALEMQHTTTQPTSQVISNYPEVGKKLKKKHGSQKMKEIVESDASMLSVHSVGRKPSIGKLILLNSYTVACLKREVSVSLKFRKIFDFKWYRTVW